MVKWLAFEILLHSVWKMFLGSLQNFPSSTNCLLCGTGRSSNIQILSSFEYSTKYKKTTTQKHSALHHFYWYNDLIVMIIIIIIIAIILIKLEDPQRPSAASSVVCLFRHSVLLSVRLCSDQAVSSRSNPRGEPVLQHRSTKHIPPACQLAAVLLLQTQHSKHLWD